MSAVTVRKGMNPNELMMEAGCDLVQGINIVLYPITNIAKQLPKLNPDLGPIAADVLPAFTKLARPLPCVAASSCVVHDKSGR